ncbi:hypothetical protein J6590_057433 [Homalodisca vitripennis]|nr:hypothetical protein J6590_057433 [Homalodisca vitripennis]
MSRKRAKPLLRKLTVFGVTDDNSHIYRTNQKSTNYQQIDGEQVGDATDEFNAFFAKVGIDQGHSLNQREPFPPSIRPS